MYITLWHTDSILKANNVIICLLFLTNWCFKCCYKWHLAFMNTALCALSPFVLSVLCEHVNVRVSSCLSLLCFHHMDRVRDITVMVHQASQFIFTSAQIRVCVAMQRQPQASAECCLCKPKVILTYETHPGQTEKVKLCLYFSISLPLNRQLCLLRGNISQTTLTAAEIQHDTKCM